MEITRLDAGRGRFCQAVRCGSLLFISGQYGDCGKDMKGQAEEIFEKCDAILARYGVDKRSIVFACIGLCDIHKNIGPFNEAWDSWIEKGYEPARTCLGTDTAAPGYLAEVSFVAAL